MVHQSTKHHPDESIVSASLGLVLIKKLSELADKLWQIVVELLFSWLMGHLYAQMMQEANQKIILRWSYIHFNTLGFDVKIWEDHLKALIDA